MTNTSEQRANASPSGEGTHYLSDAAVAARFGVTRQCVWRWSRAGILPSPIRLTPGCTRWRLADIEAWEAEREAAS